MKVDQFEICKDGVSHLHLREEVIDAARIARKKAPTSKKCPRCQEDIFVEEATPTPVHSDAVAEAVLPP